MCERLNIFLNHLNFVHSSILIMFVHSNMLSLSQHDTF